MARVLRSLPNFTEIEELELCLRVTFNPDTTEKNGLSDAVFDLANFYEIYQLHGDLQKETARLARSWRTLLLYGYTSQEGLMELLDVLMPKLEIESVVAEADRKHMQRTGVVGRLRRPWKHGLCVMLVFDQENAVTYLTESMRQMLDLSFDELYLRALANLEQLDMRWLDTPLGVPDGSRMEVITAPDGFAAARVLRKQTIREHFGSLRGRLWAACPHRDVLILGDIMTDRAFDAMREVADMAYVKLHAYRLHKGLFLL
jgi:Protein of unknown function (DUF1444)